MKREPADWVPRAGRRRASLTGVGRWDDGSSARILVSNISYEGCQIWSDHDFSCGETLELALAGHSNIKAQVRWTMNGRAGARFLTGNLADDRRARIGV